MHALENGGWRIPVRVGMGIHGEDIPWDSSTGWDGFFNNKVQENSFVLSGHNKKGRHAAPVSWRHVCGRARGLHVRRRPGRLGFFSFPTAIRLCLAKPAIHGPRRTVMTQRGSASPGTRTTITMDHIPQPVDTFSKSEKKWLV